MNADNLLRSNVRNLNTIFLFYNCSLPREKCL